MERPLVRLSHRSSDASWGKLRALLRVVVSGETAHPPIPIGGRSRAPVLVQTFTPMEPRALGPVPLGSKHKIFLRGNLANLKY